MANFGSTGSAKNICSDLFSLGDHHKRPKAIMPVIILNSSELSSAVSEIPDSYGNST